MSRLARFNRQRHNQRRHIAILLPIAMALLLWGCGKSADETSPTTRPATSTTASQPQTPSAPILRMTIDGQAWNADHAIEGMVHPPGYDRAILISGSHGPKDKNEQAFTLLLLGVDGPGQRSIKPGSADLSVVQMGNFSPSRYLAGGVLGYDLHVDLIRYSATPVLIEAKFSGTLAANDSKAMVIADGYFFYAE